MPDVIATVLERAFASNSRSTALRPLGWLIALLGATTLGCFHVGAPSWLGATFGVSTLVSSLAYLVAFAYFAVTDKDALRTERFTIQKMAIQKGFVGDDITGYVKLSEKPTLIQLPSDLVATSEKGEQQK